MRIVAIVVLAACTRPVAAPTSREASFDLHPAELSRRGAPDALLIRLRADVFTYFRMLADPFERRTCAAFAEELSSLPFTALEGDAHLEQFTVTATSYGFDDFDRGGFGPAVVDLVRYAASIHLACKLIQFECDADRTVEIFLDSYRRSLVARPAPTEPSIAKRLRARAARARPEWLDWIQQSLGPLDSNAEHVLRTRWAEYVQQVDADPEQMAIVALGTPRDGVGSSTVRRALVRLAGPTDSAADDLLVEVREGITSVERSCVFRGPPNELVALFAMSLSRREMPPVHGFVLGGSVWLQSWEPSHVELSIGDLASATELEELVIDAGNQLAHQSAWFPELERRAAQVAALDKTRQRIATLARDYARETRVAWTKFVTAR